MYIWELINYISEISFILPIATVTGYISDIYSSISNKIVKCVNTIYISDAAIFFQKKSVKFNILSL